MQNDNKKFIDELKRVHLGNWNSFFKIYDIRTSLSKSVTFKISILISIVFQLLFLVSKIDLVSLIENLVNRNLSILPNLLGFVIGAYALLLSGYSERILKRIVKTNINNDELKLPYNSFQKTSSVFGMSIFIMALSLMINYIYQIVLETKVFFNIPVEYCFALLINSITTIFLNVISIYSLLLLFNIIINLFAFSQYISGIITLSKKEDELN